MTEFNSQYPHKKLHVVACKCGPVTHMGPRQGEIGNSEQLAWKKRWQDSTSARWEARIVSHCPPTSLTSTCSLWHAQDLSRAHLWSCVIQHHYLWIWFLFIPSLDRLATKYNQRLSTWGEATGIGIGGETMGVTWITQSQGKSLAGVSSNTD